MTEMLTLSRNAARQLQWTVQTVQQQVRTLEHQLSGTRWQDADGAGGHTVVGFELLEGMQPTQQANAKLLELDGTDTGQTDAMRDPFDIFASLVLGSKGFAVFDGSEYYIIQAECPDEQREFMAYAGEWSPQAFSIRAAPYERNDVVVDWPWLMRANKTTSERPAPQPTGPPDWYAHADIPGWAGNVTSATSLLTGQRYTWAEDRFITSTRFWIPVADPTVNYTMIVVEDPLGLTPTTTVLANNLLPATTGWLEIPTGTVPVVAGAQQDFYMFSNAVASGAVFSATWDQKNSNGNPAPGELYHLNNLAQMRFHYTDKNDNDQTANLQAVTPGATINAGGFEWEVVGITLGGTNITYDVQPAVRLSEGERLYQFTSLQTQMIQYSFIQDFYFADPQVTGLFSETGIGDMIENQNAYGVDVRTSPAVVSDDWDTLAYSWGISGA